MEMVEQSKHVGECTTHRHVGVYALAVADNAILLVDKQRGPYRGSRDLPGGGIEEGESRREALERELGEETGLTLSTHEYLTTTEIRCCHRLSADRPEELRHTAHIYEVAHGERGSVAPEAPGEDVSRAAWVSLDRLGEVTLSPVVRAGLAER